MTTKYTALSTTAVVLPSSLLGGLADATASAPSDPVDNQSSVNRLLFADFYLKVGSQSTLRQSGATVNLYVVPRVSMNGAPADTPSLDGDCLHNYLGSTFRLDASNAEREIVFENVRLPPSDFVVVVENLTGQAFNAADELHMVRYSYENVI